MGNERIMTSQVLYRKWRPRNLAEVVGQEPVTQTLRNALRTGRLSHAYLFCGPRGTGKTSTARSLSKAINCLNPQDGEPCNECDMCLAINENRALDIIEIDAASNTGVDDIRSLKEKVNYSPNQAKYKVYIIDEVHMLSNSASNALLKTLEEPPAHVVFILATTEVHKLLPTILSRCQRFDFRRLSQVDVVKRLESVCAGENIEIEKDALQLVAKSATGSLRDAINLLERLATYYGSGINIQQVQAVLGMTGDMRTRELVRHIMSKDIAAGLATINGVNNDGLDLKQFNRELVEYLRGLLLIKTGAADSIDLVEEDAVELKKIASQITLEQVLASVKLFGQIEFGFDNYPTLPMELALVDCILASEEKHADTRKVGEVAHTGNPSVTSGKEMPARPAPAAKQKKDTAAPVPDKPAESAVQKDIKPESAEEKHEKQSPEPVAEQIVRAEPKAKPEPPETVSPEPEKKSSDELSALEGGTELERLKLNWKQVIELAPAEPKKSPAIAILRSGGINPISIENDTVVLSFRHKYLKEKIENPDNYKVAEKIMSNFLGRPCRITCVEENNHLVKAALKMGAQIIDQEEK